MFIWHYKMSAIRFGLLCFLMIAVSHASFHMPGQVLHWQSTWINSPITLSQDNEDVTNVGVSFWLRPETDLTSGVVEVTFPVAFGLSAGVTC
jgi:hypothetical protein